MLAPETRVLLTDALRPPDGTRVDLAIATSFSLDLTALLLAPMSFALHETDKDDLDAVDGIALLEALRRYAAKTTIFCQAGGIHPPAKYSPLMQFLEGSVCQVAAPSEGRIFHPKVWTLRFRAADNSLSHRVLVLSRNLTFDRSWDTLLQLDETADPSGASPEVAPLIAFLEALPGLATSPLESARRNDVADLASTLRAAKFQVPPDFSELSFLPLGLGESTWSFPTDTTRSLLISPFLDVGAASRWISASNQAIVLSRPESLDRVGASYFDDARQAWTLQRAAEVEVGDDPEPATRTGSESASVRDGLHAKTFVFEQGRDATVVTGSANLTTAAFGGNVEFSVIMKGSAAQCGVASLWEGTKESPGLIQLAEPYSVHELEPGEQARTDLEIAIDEFHRGLATHPPTVQVTAIGDDTVDVALLLAPGAVLSPGETFIRPISLPPIRARHLADKVRWPGQARRDVTPFFAVDTTCTRDSISVTQYAVVVVELTGDIGDRRSLAMTEILRNAHDVLRYLSLLLGDPRLDISARASLVPSNAAAGFQPTSGFVDLVLLEPLIRASARDDEAIDRVANLLAELTSMGTREHLLPAGFQELWNAVSQARETPA